MAALMVEEFTGELMEMPMWVSLKIIYSKPQEFINAKMGIFMKLHLQTLYFRVESRSL